MGLCQTFLPFLTNPLTYIGLLGAGIGGKLLYSYSSYTFLPSIRIISRFTSPLNFILNLATRAYRYNALKIVATYTTFHLTIQSLLNNGFTRQTILTLVNELWNKIILSFKNIVDGTGLLVQWITSSNKVCGLASNNELLLQAGVTIWTGVAAYIFVLWIWKLSFYNWRNLEMEQQNIVVLLIAITAISIAAHQTSLILEGLNNGMNLLEGVQNMTETMNNSVNKTGNVTG